MLPPGLPLARYLYWGCGADMLTAQTYRYLSRFKTFGEPSQFWLGTAIVLVFILILASRRVEYFFFIGVVIFALLALEKGKPILSKVLLLLGILGVIAYRSLANFLKNLGTDSFTETQKFDIDEALFFISTLSADFKPNVSVALLLLSLISALVIFNCIRQIKPKGRSKGALSCALVPVAAILVAAPTYLLVRNSIIGIIETSEIFVEATKNFRHEPPLLNFTHNGIKLVVYIGESTSIMNMSLYGYPRNTTPQLDRLHEQDQNLLVFKNVFSTHTHTSPSLLEALSLGLHPEEKFLPINARQRVSIVDVLNKNGINNALFSNQGQTGTYNLASSVIFKNSKRRFSTDSRYLGNRDYALQKPTDDEFFYASLQPALDSMGGQDSAVIFLHSYAGHGNYLDNIPQRFRAPVDHGLGTTNPIAIVGPDNNLVESVERYDSAIKYVDYSVARSIEQVKNSADPIVFIYFSDHGDSAYTGRGHDSSRFVHEMARVPFVLYFNGSARAHYPKLYEKYSRLARQENIATLAQLPSTIIDLLGGEPITPSLDMPPVIGENNEGIIPILVRKTTRGITYVDLNEVPQPLPANAGIQNVTDTQTRIFVATHNKPEQAGNICYEGANTLGKAARGALVADCLELDISLQENGKFSAYDPSEKSVDIELEKILRLAKNNNLAIWISINNLQAGQDCIALARTLSSHMPFRRQVLVELHPETDGAFHELASCAQNLRQHGMRTAFTVQRDKLLACNGHTPQDTTRAHACATLEKDLAGAADSGLFTDFSFDIAGLEVMERLPAAGRLRWNARNLDAGSSLRQMALGKLGMAILENNDPNRI
jgi:glucan phosphoethanolaminetransferase (alkaline phosphatase superfamily)